MRSTDSRWSRSISCFCSTCSSNALHLADASCWAASCRATISLFWRSKSSSCTARRCCSRAFSSCSRVTAASASVLAVVAASRRSSTRATWRFAESASSSSASALCVTTATCWAVASPTPPLPGALSVWSKSVGRSWSKTSAAHRATTRGRSSPSPSLSNSLPISDTMVAIWVGPDFGVNSPFCTRSSKSSAASLRTSWQLSSCSSRFSFSKAVTCSDSWPSRIRNALSASCPESSANNAFRALRPRACILFCRSLWT
mmetsp:Transcript_50753/g.133802  ORF Transcript_50753/g.133802 Transcript_50753/m.133802 type:complete len:258 (+) Transcript_50753:71-844(+)